MNPVFDPKRKDRWVVVNVPKTKLIDNDPNTAWKLFVFQNQDDRIMYFFSNDVAWNLGYTRPNVAVRDEVPAENKKKIKFAEGIFLTKQGVLDFIAATPDREDKTFFAKWFDEYVSKCEFNTDINVHNDCPA